MPSPVDDELAKLMAAVGWSANPFWRWWARLEILGGLAAAGAGLLLGMTLAAHPPADAGLLM
ncbi:hypothetical protein [Fimbriiglobus ruber]|uniref:Uncharacterized protein n=1 Tax=Fimbriiglobus ruber TaxID=1908690 RepID=A0A225DX74_9BACT|nr:hypothetical protein [Fimbriiglobus ruber]OWK40925.1 hypothetical protein FRUB_04817 [Fimbriiglobus ruber]